jgi:hypothetical protein
VEAVVTLGIGPGTRSDRGEPGYFDLYNGDYVVGLRTSVERAGGDADGGAVVIDIAPEPDGPEVLAAEEPPEDLPAYLRPWFDAQFSTIQIQIGGRAGITDRFIPFDLDCPVDEWCTKQWRVRATLLESTNGGANLSFTTTGSVWYLHSKLDGGDMTVDIERVAPSGSVPQFHRVELPDGADPQNAQLTVTYPPAAAGAVVRMTDPVNGPSTVIESEAWAPGYPGLGDRDGVLPPCDVETWCTTTFGVRGWFGVGPGESRLGYVDVRAGPSPLSRSVEGIEVQLQQL